MYRKVHGTLFEMTEELLTKMFEKVLSVQWNKVSAGYCKGSLVGTRTLAMSLARNIPFSISLMEFTLHYLYSGHPVHVIGVGWVTWRPPLGRLTGSIDFQELYRLGR